MKYYAHLDRDNSLKGWYTPEVHDIIPVPNIEVTEQEWQEALNIGANFYNKEIKQFECKDLRSSEEKYFNEENNNRYKRDLLIEELEPRLLKYERQSKINIETDDTEEWYINALKYLQELRDVPQQEGFPFNIVWPTLP